MPRELGVDISEEEDRSVLVAASGRLERPSESATDGSVAQTMTPSHRDVADQDRRLGLSAVVDDALRPIAQ